MSPDHPEHMPQDPLLERYREANALDPARPGPALRENVLPDDLFAPVRRDELDAILALIEEVGQ